MAAADAAHQRLTGFSSSEREMLAPMLDRGPVALVGFARGDDLPAINVATYVNAPAALVAKVIANPAAYPSFMSMLDHVKVESKQANQTAYAWRWRVGVFILEGHNRMIVQPPPPGRPGAPYRISVHSERGHLGAGRLTWKVHPRGPDRSLLELAVRIDMRDANVIMQQLDAAARSINRSVNLALAYVMALGTQKEAERQAGRTATKADGIPFADSGFEPQPFDALLRRGDLVWLETQDHPFTRVHIAGRSGVSTPSVQHVMADPGTFGESLVPGSHTTVISTDENGTRFGWGIGLPLVGAEGVMNLAQAEGTVSVSAVEGALTGGAWHFRLPKLNNWEAVMVGWARFNIADAGWLIRKIAEVDPVMAHGLAAATEVMMLRALRNRAQAHAQKVRAAKRATRRPAKRAKRAAPAASVPSP